MAGDLDAGLARYIDALERLDGTGVVALDLVMHRQIRFKDPFSDVTGIEQAQRVFAKLFADCTDVRFSVTQRFRDGAQAVLVWSMSYRLRRWPDKAPWTIDGMSRLRLDEATGLVTEHIDSWDAGQFYERLPLLGSVLGFIRRRIETK